MTLEEAWLRIRAITREQGQDLVEYALFGGVLAALLISLGVGGMTDGIMDFFSELGECIDFDASTGCG